MLSSAEAMCCASAVAFPDIWSHATNETARRAKPDVSLYIETPSDQNTAHRDASLNEYVAYESAVIAADIQSFSDQVTSIIMTHGLQQGMVAKSIAGVLGISETTLYRRLALENTTFKTLTDDLRKSLATRLLASNSVPIGEVAERLGYADSACLTRAFYRCFGTSPWKYRHSHSTDSQIGRVGQIGGNS
jgi:AraC-like DNA-binding protein